MLHIKVKDAMSSRPITIESGTTLSEALGKMMRYNVHELLVLHKNKLCGMLNYNILVKRRDLPLSTKIDNVMISPPKLTESTAIDKAAETLLSSGLRAVPVITNQKLVGILSRYDIVKVIPKMKDINTIAVEAIMTPNPTCVSELDSVDKAKILMSELDEQSIPVVDTKNLVSGMVELRDILRYQRVKRRPRKGVIIGDKTPVRITIKSIMKQPISVSSDTTVETVANLMIENNVSSVIVVDNRKPIGIVTMQDLLELILRFKKSDEVYVQITGLDEADPFVYDSMYTVINKSIRRLGKISDPKTLLIHIVQYHPTGDASKYSVRTRLSTAVHTYYTKSYDWDLLKVIDETMRDLERKVRRDKKRRVDLKRKKRT
jgi:CBS domain-containing protein/ribosome-associated translation inhibitor RaiA